MLLPSLLLVCSSSCFAMAGMDAEEPNNVILFRLGYELEISFGIRALQSMEAHVRLAGWPERCTSELLCYMISSCATYVHREMHMLLPSVPFFEAKTLCIQGDAHVVAIIDP